jgi:hypothetical protein
VEIKEWIMIISAVIVVFGWFINSYLNRRHEIFKKRLDFRLKMLESYVLVAESLEKLLNPKNTMPNTQDFIDKLEKAQVCILLYGTMEEIEIIKDITTLAQQNKHKDLKIRSSEFMNLIRANLRSELGFNSL